MKTINSCPTEHEEQVAFLQWFEMQFPEVRIFAIPNGTRASIGAAVKAKKEGVKKGVPDLFIPEWRVWVEMKRIKGGSISKEQKDWHDYLTNTCGDTVFIARGWIEASEKINQFLYSIRHL